MTAADAIRTFDGAVGIVTGGASGIGCAVARRLAERGADVVVADRQYEKASEVVRQITASGGTASAVALDVTDFPAMQRVVEDVLATRGRLDYMFNIAGIMVTGKPEDHSPEVMGRVMETNFGGASNGVLAVYPIMLDQGFGHIVNMASIAGLVPLISMGYAASKHAIVGLSTVLRREAAPRGVRVSAICPGPVRTEMLRDGGAFGIQVGTPSPQSIRRREQAMANRHLPDADECARQALRGVQRNRAIIVIPREARGTWNLYRFFPSLLLRVPVRAPQECHNPSRHA